MFPKKVRQLSYIKMLTNVVKSSNYKFAVYRDKKGKEYICKLWSGNYKNQHYYWIVNEINSYKLLNNLIDKNKKIINKKFPNIYIPKFYTSYANNNVVYFLIEKIEGKLLSQQNVDVIVDAYEKISFYFELLTKLSSNQKKHISKRNGISYFLLFHYYYILAVYRNPNLLLLLIKIIPIFYKGIRHSILKQNLSLVHRDLGGFNNIFINKNKISILDFGIFTLTLEYVNLTNIIATRWSTPRFVNKFLQSDIFKSILTDQNKLDLFNSLLVYAAIFDLGTGEGKKTSESLALLKLSQKNYG